MMIKKVFIFALIVSLFSCNKKPQNYATFSGIITNHFGKNGSISTDGYKKEIKISKEGVFSDTIHVKNDGALFTFSDGNEFTSVYLQNGDDLKLTLDTKEFDETIKYTGKGMVNNNYLAKKSLFSEKAYSSNLFELDETEFKAKAKEITTQFENVLAKEKGVAANLVKAEKESFAANEKQMLKSYYEMKKEKNRYAKLIGKPSPEFINYENFKGGVTSLKDLRGKYVYIDVWATWCGPCKAEIPHLQKLEKAYHDKNIEFVSISVDNGRGYKDNSLALSKDGWKKMIKEKQMGGIQLFADKAWKSDFVTQYEINGIPRFILIDPSGNIVDANASRPSSVKTTALFNKILK